MKYVLGAAAAALVSVSAASAATITPVFADCDPNYPAWNGAGVACGGAGRDDATAVNLGAGDGAFYSLGLETSGITGVAVFRIDPAFTGPGMIIEVTNPGTDHYEAADVFVANGDGMGGYDGSSAVYVGTVTNGGPGGAGAAVTALSIMGTWEFIYLQDASKVVFPGTGTKDGFDLDAIDVRVVPLPAGALLLGTALVGIGALRRRK